MQIIEKQGFIKPALTKLFFSVCTKLILLLVFFILTNITVHAQVNPASVNYRYVINEGTMDSSMPFARGGNSTLSAHGFRFSCIPSHFSYDDPVVFPGQPGRAHLHMFFGNTLTDYNSTSQSILNTGASTCGGGIENRSSYWVPAVINEAGEVVLPRQIMNYYKSWVSDRSQLRPIPNGLQILADDTILGSRGVVVAEPGRPEQTWSGSIRVSDHDGLSVEIIFPDCIAVDRNGNPILSSPGGTSHVAYSRGAAGCPPSHPYLIPQLTQTMNWRNVPYESNWMLSSDPSPAEKGTTAHADYVAAWNPEALRIMVDCVRDGYRECGPEITSTMERDFTTTAYGEDAYRWLILRDDANATPLGVWPSYINTPGHNQTNHHSNMHTGNIIPTPTPTPTPTQIIQEQHNHSQDQKSISTETTQKTSRIITNENLNVRNEPAGKEIITVMPSRSTGTVLSTHAVQKDGNEWIKVQFDNSTTGYVAKGFTTNLVNNDISSTRNLRLSKEQEDTIRREINRLLQQLELLQSLLRQLQ